MPPQKIFSSSEVDFEPVLANSIIEPRTLERPLHFRLPTEFSFGELEFAWLVRIVAWGVDSALFADSWPRPRRPKW